MFKKQISAFQFLGVSLIWFSAGFFSTPLLAAPGDLDTTFGSGGKVISSYGGISQFAPAVKIQPDGKIVTVGKHYNGHDDDFLVQRFLTDGSPDTAFGTGGATVIKFSISDDNAKSLDIQPDGKIIIAGGAGQSGSYEISALVRVTANGAIDTSFGNGGKVTADFGTPSHNHSVALQSDGKILVAGESYTSGDGGMFVVARFLTSGAPDTSFGVNGKVVQTFGTGANAHSLVLQADGKLLIGGYTTSADTGKPGFLVARFLANGTLDTGFGTNGSSFVSVGTGANYCHVLMLQSDGKIILSGGAMTSNNYDFTLVRFNSNGTLDTSFGTGGIVTTNFVSGTHPSGEETAGGVIQSDGKIVVGGYSEHKFALARYLSTGALDTSFGTGGMVTTTIGTDNDDWIKSLALQPSDGKIVAAGYSKNGSTFNLAVARFINDTASATTNYSDSWWNASESGWGLTITDHGTSAFIQWYTYDQTGHNQKYVFSGTFSSDKCQLSGNVSQVSGPGWTLPSFDPNLVTRRTTGAGAIDFCPSGLASGTIVFNYTNVDGVTGSKQLTRLPFGNDVPHLGGTANTGAADFTDLWWNPSESGWGVSVTQHGNNLVFRIFVYDDSSRPLLFVVSSVTYNSATSFTGAVALTAGPWFGSNPFDPNQVVRTATPGNTATLTFSDANNGVLSYTVNGVTKTRAITRMVF